MAAVTIQWEDGVRASGPLPVASKSAAFAALDSWMRSAGYPDSLHVQILEDGIVTWAQWGSNVTVNL